MIENVGKNILHIVNVLFSMAKHGGKLRNTEEDAEKAIRILVSSRELCYNF